MAIRSKFWKENFKSSKFSGKSLRIQFLIDLAIDRFEIYFSSRIRERDGIFFLKKKIDRIINKTATYCARPTFLKRRSTWITRCTPWYRSAFTCRRNVSRNRRASRRMHGSSITHTMGSRSYCAIAISSARHRSRTKSNPVDRERDDH